MDKAPSLEETYKEKIKYLEEKIKFLENENKLQKDLITSLHEQIILLKEKLQMKPESANKINQNNSINAINFKNISEREPIHFMSKHHANYIYCIAILKNKRLVSGGYDTKIIIYDKNYTHPELEIKEHSAAVTSLIVASNGNLISSSCDKTLKIFKIEESTNKTGLSLNYFLLQTINTTHSDNIIHVRELSSNKLVSCSLDTQLNFYLPQNNNYSLEITIDVPKAVYDFLEILNDQLVVSFADSLHLFSLKNRKFIKELKEISCYPDCVNDCLCLLKQNHLVVCGNGYLYVVDLIQFKLLNKINTNSNNISLCYWNDRLFVGTNNGMIQEYKVDDMNLSKISFKEKCHQNWIWQLLLDDEGNLISCSHDNYIKIWK